MDSTGRNLLEQRKRKGLSQEALSELSGINLRTLQRIEKGDSTPRGATLKSLCQALEINIEEFVTYGNKVEDVRYIKLFYLSALSFLVIPLGNIIVPLILWLPKRHKIAQLDERGLNLVYPILLSIQANPSQANSFYLPTIRFLK
jgi:transcriptional regulator with XRE-family HTH domain